MKKLGIIILGLLLFVGCSAALSNVEKLTIIEDTIKDLIKVERRASNVDYELLDLGECRVEDNGFTFCNIAEAVNPKSGHVLQWIDTDYLQEQGLDGKCDTAVLFMSQTDGLYFATQNETTCDEATEIILESTSRDQNLEDHYKESELFKGDSLLKKE